MSATPQVMEAQGTIAFPAGATMRRAARGTVVGPAAGKHIFFPQHQETAHNQVAHGTVIGPAAGKHIFIPHHQEAAYNQVSSLSKALSQAQMYGTDPAVTWCRHIKAYV